MLVLTSRPKVSSKIIDFAFIISPLLFRPYLFRPFIISPLRLTAVRGESQHLFQFHSLPCRVVTGALPAAWCWNTPF